jgi:hypothetical protein
MSKSTITVLIYQRQSIIDVIYIILMDVVYILRLREDEDRIQPPKCCILNKKGTMDNVQNHNNRVNILTSQSFKQSTKLCIYKILSRVCVFIKL